MLPREQKLKSELQKLKSELQTRSNSIPKNTEEPENSLGLKKIGSIDRINENAEEVITKTPKEPSRGRSKTSKQATSPNYTMSMTISRLLKTKDGLKTLKEQTTPSNTSLAEKSKFALSSNEKNNLMKMSKDQSRNA